MSRAQQSAPHGPGSQPSDRSTETAWGSPRRQHRPGPRRRGPSQVDRAVSRSLHVRRAFGEPIQHGAVTLVPVAVVSGASGSAQRQQKGRGRFALQVKPLGVYVVQGSEVVWRPAVEVNRIVLGGQLVGAVALIAVAAVMHDRLRTR